MRFVPAKGEDQQAMLVLHRVREQLLKQRTATINALRAIWPSSGSSLSNAHTHITTYQLSSLGGIVRSHDPA